jgi:class 3 adenylate cyclase/CHASE2 domain-containing sensor protein
MDAQEQSAGYEIVHVLCMDIVEYSLQPIDRQTELLTLLQRSVRETAEFQLAEKKQALISLPTGDGMALVFVHDPLSPVKCALEIAAALRHHKELRLRMGIHTGPILRHADIKEQVNVVGGGINMAQRVMDYGDAGHILLSRNVAEILQQLSDWRDVLQDLGEQQVKHGVTVHLYNLWKKPLGNPNRPHKLASQLDSLVDKPTPPSSDNFRAQGGLPPTNIERLFMAACAFLAACIFSFGSDAWLDHGLNSGESNGLNQLALSFSGLYQGIVAQPRYPMPRYTAVIEIDPELDPGSISLHDICGQRKMMTALLRKVAIAMPGVIVIDKYFGQGSCSDEVNVPLARAISDISRRIPVVVGRRVVESAGYLLLSLPLEGAREAIVNIDPDTRKLPLKWRIFASKEDIVSGAAEWRETLALKAADAYEGGQLLLRHPRLQRLLDPVQHPYISFLGTDQFKQFRFLAGYVLCGREVMPGEDASACPGWAPELKALSGKVVLIGELNRDEDEHSTVIGRISGLYLQANFIEALLDDRYYRGTPVVNYVIGFAFVVCLELTLAFVRNSWRRLAAISVLFAAMLFVVYVVIADFHLYVNPLPLVALALIARALVAMLTERRLLSRP